MLFLEIGYDQAEPVVGMMNERFADIHIVKDLSGLDRVVYGHLR
jgi:methylase of polypeptide subunit release factors